MTHSFNNKREVERKKQSKKLAKLKRKEERQGDSASKSFDDMIAYVDENGQITDTPPDPTKKHKVNAGDIAVSTPKKEEQDDPFITGRVEYYNAEKGFGFIKELQSVEKYFFHINNAPANIAVGHKVRFELEKGTRGLNAVRIEQIKEEINLPS